MLKPRSLIVSHRTANYTVSNVEVRIHCHKDVWLNSVDCCMVNNTSHEGKYFKVSEDLH